MTISFKRPLIENQHIWQFQNTRMVLSDVLVQIHTLELMIYKAAHLADKGDERAAQLTMESKVLAARVCVNVADAVMQLCGAKGYTRGHKIERLYRDAKAIGTMGPTTELSREYVASDWWNRGEYVWEESISTY